MLKCDNSTSQIIRNLDSIFFMSGKFLINQEIKVNRAKPNKLKKLKEEKVFFQK